MVLLPGSGMAQNAPATSAAASGTAPVVQLDPFSVTADSDVGFVAASSLAGGRIATALKDTPVAYSVVTKEFLDAFNITEIGEAANFTVGADWHPGEGTDKNYAAGSGNRVRIRGIGQNMKARNFFQMDYQQADSYNVDRIDYARGANSVLFGPGGAAGTQNINTKQAVLGRDITDFRLQLGSYNMYRVTADINRTMGDRFALRTNVILGAKDTFRDRLWEDKHGIHVTATYQVSPKFTIRAEAEYYTVNEAHAVQHWNDYTSAWDGKTVDDGQAMTSTEMAKAGVQRSNGTFVVRPDYNGQMYNWTGTLRTRDLGRSSNIDSTRWVNTPEGRMPIRTVGFRDRSPFDGNISTIGITDEVRYAPTMSGSPTFQIGNVKQNLNYDDPGHNYPTFSQRIKDVAVYLNYRVTDNWSIELAGDMNETPRLANNFYRRRTRWVRTDLARNMPTGEPNPWFLHQYSDQAPYWQQRSEEFTNIRLQSVYAKETRFGNLQLGVMAGTSERFTPKRSSTNIVPATWILPDARGWVENGENNEFFAYNRVYLDEADRSWATHWNSLQTRPVTVQDPVNGVTGAQVTPYWIYDSRRNTNVSDATRNYKFAQVAGNFDLFNNRLVFIGAVRRDITEFSQQRVKTPGWNPAGWMGVTHWQTQDWKLPLAPDNYWDLTYFPKDANGVVTGPEKPADARPRRNDVGTRIQQEQYDGDVFRDDFNSPDVNKSVNTWSIGAVLNVTRWLGVFGNKSTTFDFSNPQQDIRGLLVEQPTSESEDVGLRFNLPNNRLAASIAWFHSFQENAPAGIAGGFLRNYNAVGDLGPIGDFFNRNTRDLVPFRTNNTVTSTTKDTTGYEVEVTANLTPNWRLVVNASTADAAQVNYGTDALNFMNENWGKLRNILADGGVLIDASGEAYINPALNDPALINVVRAEEAAEGYNTLLTSTYPQISERNSRRAPTRGATDRWMYNIATDYRIQRGALSGLRVGFAANIRPGMIINDKSGYTIQDPNDPTKAMDDPSVDASDAMYGDAYMMTRASLSYTVNLRESRKYFPKVVHFDLNVNNVFDKTEAIFAYNTGSSNTDRQIWLPNNGLVSDPSRYGIGGNPFYLEPRTFTLTARMEF